MFERARRALTKAGPERAAAFVLACLTVVVPSLIVTWPWWTTRDTFGFHDWDVQTSHRHLAVRSLVEHGEWPGWNPYACGGFPAWSYVESGTNVVSPWLPLYLGLDMRWALRLEVLGMALLGAAGSYLAAGRFTSSLGARALVVALFAVNGRWGLQTAAGHTWHLAYALLPWALWAFERAREGSGSLRHCVALGVCFAMLVYAGGIYPLPHTVLLLASWSVLVAAQDRTLRPIAILAAGGAIGVGLSAPKLFPILATFQRAPRLIASDERMDLAALWTALTSRQQGFFDRPAPVEPYGWHEWGIYVSLPGALLLTVALVFAPGRRESLLKLLALLFVVLGLGAFHELAPWTLLHEHAPVFRSQHVPSRFLYPAVFLTGLLLASWVGALVTRFGAKRRWLDAAVAALALALACDVALIAQQPMAAAMSLHAPPIAARPDFRFEQRPPLQYRPRDWAGPMYLAMLGNVGVIDCYGAPPFDDRGALAASDRRYRGEAYVEPAGEAVIEAWSPNGATLRVRGAERGARLIYNMNYDRGWTAHVEGPRSTPARVVRDRSRVAVELPEGDSLVVLSYRPPGLRAGVAALLVTAAALGGAAAWRRRAARRAAEEGA